LKVIKNLGAGAFGLVKLVKVKGIDHRAFALKCIKKHQVVEYKQQRHVIDEKITLATMQSPFILGLLKTFRGMLHTVCIGTIPWDMFGKYSLSLFSLT
jgi:serine/threonine protein kinase